MGYEHNLVCIYFYLMTQTCGPHFECCGFFFTQTPPCDEAIFVFPNIKKGKENDVFSKENGALSLPNYPIMQQPSLQPNEGQLAQMQRRFGMFLHFGVNTFNNTEWSDGTLPVESYCPSAIDADSWVRTAYEAGMNYVVLITKHHDGFCLWDTHTTTYSVNYSPNQTDVVRAVADACRKYASGWASTIRFGIGTNYATGMTRPMSSTWKSI